MKTLGSIDTRHLKLVVQALNSIGTESSFPRFHSVEQMAAPKGGSGATLNRYRIYYTDSLDPGTIKSRTFILKKTSPLERRVLELLGRQTPGYVPKTYCISPAGDRLSWVCMHDAGTTSRPAVTSPLSMQFRTREAQALATIHAANIGENHLQSWLPATDRQFFYETTHSPVFRNAWTACMQDSAFVVAFRPYLPRVEQALATIVDDLDVLTLQAGPLTLIHTDLHPGNVVMNDASIVVVDWASARFGSFYLDLPHHFDTLKCALVYKRMLARVGHNVPLDEFEHFYRIASRYVGLRQIWWPMQQWLSNKSTDAVLRQYFEMICYP